MLRSLQIENFRALRKFSMSGLGRVNLLVGNNNSGKTSVLEAIHILSIPGKTDAVWDAMWRRGELIEGHREIEADVANLIHEHRIHEGEAFSIRGNNAVVDTSVVASFRPPRSKTVDDDEPTVLEFGLHWQRVKEPWTVRWPVTQKGGLKQRSSLRISPDLDEREQVHFITTEGLARDIVVEFFDAVVLTEDEATVLEALKTIEPGIERIAAVGSGRFATPARGGIAMMVNGRRLPIGSMGDGIWRLLGIALALVRARGGILLVDEIDTGLHYSVLEKMWNLVFETARRLDVQVFATTHSRDCVEALAAIAETDRHEISIQRIERDKPEAIAFDEAEIQVAAERGIEVR